VCKSQCPGINKAHAEVEEWADRISGQLQLHFYHTVLKAAGCLCHVLYLESLKYDNTKQ